MLQNFSHWEEVFDNIPYATLFIYSCFRNLECCNYKWPRNNRCKNKSICWWLLIDIRWYTRNRLINHYLCLIHFQNVLNWELILTRPKQYGFTQGAVDMNSYFQINNYHGTFLEKLSYWVLISICQNLIKHWEILQKRLN